MLPTLPRLPGAVRRVVRYAAVALLALVIVTCTDNPIGPGHPGVGRLNVVPVYPAYARVAPLAMDNFRIIVVRPPADTLANVSSTFNSDSSQVQTRINVSLNASSEDLDVTIELYAGGILLFRGTRTVRVSQGSSTPADSVPVTYQGPGAQLATLTVSPRDTTVPFGAAFSFGASATDSGGNPLAQFYVSWDASAGSINGQALFTAPAARDTVIIRAITPTGIADSTTVIVVAPPATLTKVSGDGQSGIIGTRLPQPLVVRVDGSDGQPVSGVPVIFAVVSGGGSLDSATVTSDGQGLAAMGATLGTTVGAQSFSASASGLTAVTFTATGTGGGVKTWTGSVDGNWTTAGNWSPAAVPIAGDSVVIPLASNAPTFTGTGTIGALSLTGNAAFMSVSGALTVSGSVTLPDSNQFVTVTSGSLTAATLTLSGFQAFLDASSGALTVSGTTALSGDRSFIDATGTAPAFGPVVASGAQAFLSQRGGTTGAIQLTGSTAFWTTEGTITVTGNPALVVSGTGAFASTSSTQPTSLTLAGDVQLGGTGGYFDLGAGGTRVTVNGNLSVTGTAFLRETFATDTMVVTGTASFTGGDEAGKLTAGGLFVGGNFTQGGAVATSFAGTGTHSVFLNGAGAQTLSFSAPGFASSRFQNVIVANSAGGITATSDVYASGTAGVTPTAVRTLNGNGSTLFTTILNVSNFTFNNLLLDFAGSTVVTFDTVSFQGYAPTATPLTISHPGAAAPLTFLNVSFGVTPTSGFYLDATDTSPTDGVPLVIDMVNPSPLNPGSFVQTAGGAVVNWPAGVAPGTWTGVVDTSWNTAGNWSDGQVPTATTDVTIPAGTPFAPTTSGTVRPTRDLTVQSGATLTLGGGGLNINGSLDAAGLITGTVAGFTLAGTGTVRGTATGTTFIMNVNGTYSLNGRLVATDIAVNGSLDLAGHTAVVGGSGSGNNFSTSNNGVLIMQSPLDSLIMTGGNPVVSFSGGSTAGKLTNGVIYMINAGFSTFTQSNTFNDSSYAPTGAHKVVLATGTSVAFDFKTPGAGSQFNHLDVSAQTAGISLIGPVQVNGTFTSQPSATAPAINGGNKLFTLAGPVQVTGLTLTNAPFLITGDNPVTFDNVTLQGFITTVTQLQVSGTGAAARTFNNLTFSTTPTGAGLYLAATDTDGAGTNGALTVNMVGTTPATPGSFTSVTNGAVINWPPAPPAITWTGAVSTDWSVAGNWSPAQVPTSANDVIIPASLPTATVTSSCAAKSLTVNGPMSLGTFDCQVQGNVVSNGVITGTTGRVVLLGPAQINGNFPNLLINAPVTVAGATGLGSGNGNITIDGATASLTLNGQTLVMPGSLVVQNGGTVVMTNAADVLTVSQDVLFDGGDETGRLTAGRLTVVGNFAQAASGSANSFRTGGNHLTVITGGPTTTITFASPASSRFQELDVTGRSTGLVLGSSVTIAGQLISTPSGANGPTISTTAPGSVLTSGGIDAVALSGFTALTFDGVPLVLSGGLIGSVDALTFVNQNPSGTALTVNNAGQPSAYTFNNLTFGTVLTAGGFHLVANDLDGPTPDPLTIDVLNSNPASGAGVSQATNGAVINWPPTGAVFTWTGAVSQDWNVAGNWDKNAVPSPIDDVVLVPITNQPKLTTSVGIHNLTSQAGSLLDIGDSVLVVGGDVDLLGQINGNPGTGGVVLGGTGSQVVHGIFNTTVAVNGTYALSENTVVGGDLVIAGQLDVGSFNITISGNLTTIGSGVLIEAKPASFVDVGADAIFSGGSTAGRLTAGTLRIAGNFLQLATNSAQSFSADPGHLTEMSGNPVDITFTTPGPTLSHFGDFAESGYGATFVITGDMVVQGYLSGGDGFGGTIQATSCPTKLTVHDMQGFPTFDCVQLILDDPGGTTSSTGGFTFINMPTDVTQLTIRHPGTASGTLSTSSMSFFPLTAGDAGHYVDAQDTDGSSPFLLVSISSANVGNGPSFTLTSGGAQVLWPGGAVAWTGGSDNNWSNFLNWSNFAVPTSATSVIIPANTNPPQLTNAVTQVGSVDVQSGMLSLNGHRLDVSGTFQTSGSGFITMGSGGDSLIVSGDITFNGADESGQIVAGVIQGGGNFTQGGSLASPGFVGQGTNLVVLNGGTTTINAVGSNLTTVFASLQLATSGPVTINGPNGFNVDGTGSLQVLTPVTVTYNNGGGGALSFSGATTTVSGSSIVAPVVELFPGSSIAGGWTVDTTMWNQGGAASLQVPKSIPYNHLVLRNGNNFFFDSGTWSIPGDLITRVVNAGTIRLADQSGLPAKLTVGGKAEIFGLFLVSGGKLAAASLNVATLGGSNGRLSMTSNADSVIISGNANFNGGSTSGLLTAGTLVVGGAFNQVNSTSNLSFAASGSHITKLGAGGARAVTFATPGTGAAGSHFNTLDFTAATGGLTFGTDAFVDSALVASVGAGAPKLSANGQKLTARQWNVQTGSIDHLQMALVEGATGLAQTFNGVTFSGFPTTATTEVLLDLSAAGSALANRPIQFNNVNVQTTLGSGGLYARLVSSNGLGVTLTMNASNDPTGGPSRSDPPFGTTVAGARIVWQ